MISYGGKHCWHQKAVVSLDNFVASNVKILILVLIMQAPGQGDAFGLRARMMRRTTFIP